MKTKEEKQITKEAHETLEQMVDIALARPQELDDTWSRHQSNERLSHIKNEETKRKAVKALYSSKMGWMELESNPNSFLCKTFFEIWETLRMDIFENADKSDAEIFCVIQD